MSIEAIIDRYEEGVIGLPKDGRFIPVTNSMVSKMTCLRRLWFSQVEGLRFRTSGGPIDRGSSWDIITEDMYLWWEVMDAPYPESALDTCVWCKGTGAASDGVHACDHCSGTGAGVIVRAMSRWWEAMERPVPPFGEDDIALEEERLRRALRGYVERFEAAPLQHFKIVGVQTKLARVILNPVTGKPYRPDTFLVKTEQGLMRAGTAAFAAAVASGGKVRRVNWPVYQVGAMDALARDRGNGQGWVIDAKYTKAMNSFNERLQVDPQLPGYCWLLDANLDEFGMTGVAGMMYDLTSSKMHGSPYNLKWKSPAIGVLQKAADEAGHDVKDLKKSMRERGVKGEEASLEWRALLGISEGHGGFSTSASKCAGVPSWRMRDAVEHAAVQFPNEVKIEDYEEAIEWCSENVDDGLYERPWRTFSEGDLNRYAAETFGKVRALAGYHRSAARAASPADLDVAFPRTPVCSLPGGTCSYRGPCAADSPEVRDHFDQRPHVVWRDTSAAVDNTPNLHEELGF